MPKEIFLDVCSWLLTDREHFTSGVEFKIMKLYIGHKKVSVISSLKHADNTDSFDSLSSHLTLLVIALGRSSRQHPVSTQLMNVSSCWSANAGMSLDKCHLWIYLHFTSCVQHVLSVLLWWFGWWEVSGHTAAVLLGAAFRIFSEQHVASLCSSEAFC